MKIFSIKKKHFIYLLFFFFLFSYRNIFSKTINDNNIIELNITTKCNIEHNIKNCEIIIKNPNKIRNIPFVDIEKNKKKINPKRIQIWQFALENPNRFIIDFKNRDKFLIKINNNNLKKDSLITEYFRIFQKNFGVRLIIDYSKKNDFNIKYNQEQNGDIVIKIKNVIKNNFAEQEIKKIDDIKKNIITKNIKNINNVSYKTFNIVIDAGHGGRDPGTISKNKNKEKVLTLKYAINLKKKLLENQTDKIKFKVFLIRDTDKFITIRKRVEMARKNKADIFISFHADSCPDLKAKGSTIYVIENIQKYHKDRKYFFLESYTPMEILKIESNLIKNIFIEFLKYKSRNSSKFLARIISREFKKNFILNKMKEKEASFGVLRGLDILASLLIEIGYLTNAEEEKKMLSDGFMNKFNESLTKSILTFCENY